MSSPIDINQASSANLSTIFKDKKQVDKIIQYRVKKGYFTRRQDLALLIGTPLYKTIRKRIIINPPSKTFLDIVSDHSFLNAIKKYNDNDVQIKIDRKAQKIITYDTDNGFIYILKNPKDKHAKWYKIGFTKKKPEKRAKEWGYELLYSKATANVKIMERLIHKYLNFCHHVRSSINGRGLTEVEWFYLSYELIKRTVKACISIYNTDDVLVQSKSTTTKKAKMIKVLDVYVTPSGKKYHMDIDCQYVRHMKGSVESKKTTTNYELQSLFCKTCGRTPEYRLTKVYKMSV